MIFGLYDTVMANTVGLAYRAYTGKLDPWTKNKLTDEETANLTKAGLPVEQARSQAEKDVATASALPSVTYCDEFAKVFGVSCSTLFVGLILLVVLLVVVSGFARGLGEGVAEKI